MIIHALTRRTTATDDLSTESARYCDEWGLEGMIACKPSMAVDTNSVDRIQTTCAILASSAFLYDGVPELES